MLNKISEQKSKVVQLSKTSIQLPHPPDLNNTEQIRRGRLKIPIDDDPGLVEYWKQRDEIYSKPS